VWALAMRWLCGGHDDKARAIEAKDGER